MFTTGHQANVGSLGTILSPGDTVVVDSGDHASILDGCLVSRAKLRPFRHGRLDKLESTLEKAANDPGGVLVVVDGVFSMEGDVAPLPEIAELCSRYGARLMVDEAHALGVLGARGAGSCELLDVENRVDLRMATFSKSLASCGGVIAGPADVIEYLRVTSRSFIFTASGVPAALGAALAAVRICRSDEGRQLFARVLDNARYLHGGLDALGYRVVAPTRLKDGTEIVTPVVPVVVGDDWKAAFLWKALYEAGVFVNTAIHPAVPLAWRAAAHERDGDSRSQHARPRARRSSTASSASSSPSTDRCPPAEPQRPAIDGTPAWRVSAIGLVHSRTRPATKQKMRSVRINGRCDVAVTEPFVLGSEPSNGGGRPADRSADRAGFACRSHFQNRWPTGPQTPQQVRPGRRCAKHRCPGQRWSMSAHQPTAVRE